MSALRAIEAPPTNLDAEAVVLSDLLLDPNHFDEVARIITSRDFYSRANGLVFDAIRALRAQQRAVDIISVGSWLRDHGHIDAAGGTPYLAQLVDATPAVAHVEEHARLVRAKSLSRTVAAGAAAIEAGARSGEAPETLAPALRALAERVEAEGRPDALEVLDVQEIFAPLPPVPYVVAALDLCPGAPALVAGYGFSGKTLALQSLALSVASGQKAWGCFPVARGRVLHLDFEQGARLTRERYQRLAAGLMVTPEELEGRLALASMPSLYLDERGAEDRLCRALDGYAMVIIDSLRASAPSLEENSSDVRRALDLLGRISERTGAATVVVHHARKPTKEAAGGAKASIRGSGAIFDACSSVLVFEGAKGEPVRISHEKARASGRLADDFQLTIADVPNGSDPRWGLIVSAEACSQTAGSRDGAAELDALKRRIVEFIRANGPQPGKNALAKRMSVNRNDFFAAMAELEAEGTVVNVGTYQRPSLEVRER